MGFSNVAPRHVANNPSGEESPSGEEEEEEEDESLFGIFQTREAIPELGGGRGGSSNHSQEVRQVRVAWRPRRPRGWYGLGAGRVPRLALARVSSGHYLDTLNAAFANRLGPPEQRKPVQVMWCPVR